MDNKGGIICVVGEEKRKENLQAAVVAKIYLSSPLVQRWSRPHLIGQSDTQYNFDLRMGRGHLCNR